MKGLAGRRGRDGRNGQCASPRIGHSRGPHRVTPCATRLAVVVAALAATTFPPASAADRVRHLSQWTLEHAAERAVTTGGVTGRCHGCATPYMRRLSRELVARAFEGDARRWALCVVGRESGFNPGAVSPTHDYGLAQIHVAAHPWVNGDRLLVDPVYAVETMRHLSRAGTNRDPWRGGSRRC